MAPVVRLIEPLFRGWFRTRWNRGSTFCDATSSIFESDKAEGAEPCKAIREVEFQVAIGPRATFDNASSSPPSMVDQTSSGTNSR